jgi:hypothetical protein
MSFKQGLGAAKFLKDVVVGHDFPGRSARRWMNLSLKVAGRLLQSYAKNGV